MAIVPLKECKTPIFIGSALVVLLVSVVLDGVAVFSFFPQDANNNVADKRMANSPWDFFCKSLIVIVLIL